MATAGNITAVLTLNSSGFKTGLESAISSLDKFKTNASSISGSIQILEKTLNELDSTLSRSKSSLESVNSILSNNKNFNEFALAINRIATAFKTLSSSQTDVEMSMNVINSILREVQSIAGNSTIKVQGLASALRELRQAESSTASSTEEVKAKFTGLSTSVNPAKMTLIDVGKIMRELHLEEQRQKQNLEMLTREFNQLARAIQQETNATERAVNEENQYNVLKIKTQSMLERERLEHEKIVASITKESEAMMKNGAEKLRNMGYTGKLSVEEERLAVSEEKQSVATDKATNSMDRQTSATSRLSKAMSSLRMIGTMVASMMVYNFAHSLITATRETVNAKSEMEGYFQMLNFSSGQINDFNKALDETVKKFPRLNKYALGETISSIGVEFELTTQEMEKAMPVVSMITSEYLRAGRNVNEASLAVKDILQGEFQRLSRETGVKGDQLKEAGWSGDKNDVMGLLDALKKVGESRNWDVFVTKANSLNDAVLILQNRFGEWSADMVNKVQPVILGVFNAIMDVGTEFGEVFNGVIDWLGGNSWSASAVKIGAVAFALRNVLLWLVNVRTGANLLQMAQMGLTKSIGATVLGLNAEKVATLGVRGALAQKLTGLTAEKIAEVGSTQAIYGHILGLNAEEVAENGLVGAINKSIIARAEETVETEVQTGANIGFLGSLMAVVTGEEIATGTTLTLSEALGVLTAEMLMNPITWFIGALMALAGAFYVATGGLSDHWSKMQEFNQIMQDSDEIIKEHDEYLKNLGETVGTSSDEYVTAQRKIWEFNTELGHSKALVEEYKNELAGLDITISTNLELNSKYAGLSKDQIDELSHYVSSLTEGHDTYYRALQVIHKQEEDQDKSDRTLLKNMQDRDADFDEIVKRRGDHAKHWEDYIRNSAEHNTSEDWWGGTWAGIMAGWNSFEIWMDYKSEDFANWYNDFEKTFRNAPKELDDAIAKLQLPDIGKMWNDWVGDAQKSLSDSGKDFSEMWKNNVEKPIVDSWNHFWSFEWIYGGDDSNSLQARLGQWMSDAVGSIDVLGFLNDLFVKPFEDIDIGEIFSNALFHTDETGESSGVGIAKHIDMDAWLKSWFGVDLNDLLNRLMTDPFGTLGIELPDFDLIGTLIDNLLNNNTESGEGTGVKTFDFTWIPQAIYDSISSAFSGWVGDIDIVGFISNLIPPNAEGMYQWAMDNIITPLVDGVKQGILNTPILGDVASLLGVGGDTETSSQESGQTVGTNFTTGIQTGLAPLDGVINTAFQGLNLDAITSNFTSNTSTMVTNATSTATNVGTSFTTMKNNHKASVDAMVNNNTTAFRDMQTKSNTNMLQMRDSTSNVTKQMTDAWALMRDSIVASATKIKNDSKSRFDTLGQTIGGFYRKIQNPSLWGGGAGYGSTPRRVARNPSVGKALVRGVRTRGGYAGGLDSKSTGATMSISQLKKQLCPSGECGSIFDGYKSTDEVNVWEFLQGIGGNHGLGGWNFAEPHNTFIKNKSDAWGTAPPIIDLVGGIHTSTGFKVGEFNNGTPKVSFSTFEQIATAIFSRIPYRLYFDSSWKGSWLGALQAGACNCYDGALALMALASTFGFSTGMGHGTWTDPSGKKTAHVWAIINGVKMDTTGMQQRGTWRPSASAGGSPTGSSDSKTVNVTVDMQGATIYGVDDLDSKIQESVQKGLQAEFNDPYTITI